MSQNNEATILIDKNIDCNKKGILKFKKGQVVTIIKELNSEQVIVANDFGEAISYLKSQIKLL